MASKDRHMNLVVFEAEQWEAAAYGSAATDFQHAIAPGQIESLDQVVPAKKVIFPRGVVDVALTAIKHS